MTIYWNLKTKAQIGATVFLAIYLMTVLLTNISLVGYWTDVVFSVLFSLFALILTFKNSTEELWLTYILRTSNIICTLIVFVSLGLNAINPFFQDTLKTRSFYFQQVDSRLFNAYFKPVGSYAGGYGQFWITETPKYFPIIEWQVYYDSTVDWDFSDDNYDGQDTYKVVKGYIKNEVIDNPHNNTTGN